MAKLPNRPVLNQQPPLQRKEVPYIDKRVAPDILVTDFKDHVIVRDSDGALLVPYDTVKQLFIENELLRETLYSQNNNHYSRAIDRLMLIVGQSTSDVIKAAERISNLSQKTIAAKHVYSLVYQILVTQHGVNWDGLQEKESKLQYLWRTGWLPMVTVIMHALEITLIHYQKTPEFLSLCRGLNNKVKAGANKPANLKGSSVALGSSSRTAGPAAMSNSSITPF